MRDKASTLMQASTGISSKGHKSPAADFVSESLGSPFPRRHSTERDERSIWSDLTFMTSRSRSMMDEQYELPPAPGRFQRIKEGIGRAFSFQKRNSDVKFGRLSRNNSWNAVLGCLNPNATPSNLARRSMGASQELPHLGQMESGDVGQSESLSERQRVFLQRDEPASGGFRTDLECNLLGTDDGQVNDTAVDKEKKQIVTPKANCTDESESKTITKPAVQESNVDTSCLSGSDHSNPSQEEAPGLSGIGAREILFGVKDVDKETSPRSRVVSSETEANSTGGYETSTASEGQCSHDNTEISSGTTVDYKLSFSQLQSSAKDLVWAVEPTLGDLSKPYAVIVGESLVINNVSKFRKVEGDRNGVEASAAFITGVARLDGIIDAKGDLVITFNTLEKGAP